jgi:glycine/D-amino acid oxidase-like deaminating enzyme
MAHHTDVLVIGAGVIGTAVAYNLAKEGIEVLVVERDGIGEGTSGACDGFVILQSKSPGIHLELAMESAKLYTNLAEELEYHIHYKRPGGLILIETPEQLAVMREVVAKQKRSGLEVELIGGDEARKLEPTLSANVIAAAYSTLDGHVNPIYATIGYAQAAQKLGVEFWKKCPVTAIEVKDGRIDKVITPRGEIKARWVVNACGAWAPAIGAMVGLEIPIIPRRGQTLVTETLAPVMEKVLLCARYIAIKHNPDIIKSTTDPSLKLGIGLSLEQTDTGNILLGNNREFVGYDRGTTLAAAQAIANYASRFVPFLQDVHIIRTFAGLRPYTPDGLPILGPVAGVDGFIMAAGHEGDGIALAPITGKIIAEYIRTGRPSFPLEAFHLSRFSGQASA